MNIMALLGYGKHVKDFFVKNWKLILILFAVAVTVPIIKKVIRRIKLKRSIEGYKNNAVAIDYELLALQINDAFNKFLWFDDEGKVISIINSLSSFEQFKNLSRVYAVNYSDDLREMLRKQMTDKQYAKLSFK